MSALRRLVGASLPRTEDPALLKGEGTFLDDIKVEGVLHAAFVRSSHAHAKILRIDPEPARNSPGIVAVLTGKELAAVLTRERMPLGFTPEPDTPTLFYEATPAKTC